MFYIEYIDNYIILTRGFGTSRVSMLVLLFGTADVEGAFMEGSGALRQAGKTKMGKTWPNFKSTVLINYSPRFRLLLTCQSNSPSPKDSESTQSQNMVTRAENDNTCTKCQYVVVLLTAIQSYSVTHAQNDNT